VDRRLGEGQGRGVSVTARRGTDTGGRVWVRLARALLVVPTVGWTVAFFVLPLGLVAVYSFGRQDFVTFTTQLGFSGRNYANLFDGLYLDTLLRSLVVSAATTVICALVGVPLAYFTARQSPRRQAILLVAILAPFFTSFLVRTYAWVPILDNGGPVQSVIRGLGIGHGDLNVLYSSYSIAIGMVYSYLPLMVLPIYLALERLDPALLDAAADLGGHGWRLVLRVVVPLAMPGIVAGCVLVGIPATGELVVPQVLGGGKTLMLGNVLQAQYLDVGNLPFGSAIAMTLVVLVLVIYFAGRVFGGRGEEVLA
jgi:ABC-type spermidine/putrescine transport system permease subunit I